MIKKYILLVVVILISMFWYSRAYSLEVVKVTDLNVEYRLLRYGELRVAAASWDGSLVPKNFSLNVFVAKATVSVYSPSEVFMLPLATEYSLVGSITSDGYLSFVPNIYEIVNLSCQKTKAKPFFNNGANGFMIRNPGGILETKSFTTRVTCR